MHSLGNKKKEMGPWPFKAPNGMGEVLNFSELTDFHDGSVFKIPINLRDC